MVKEYLIKIMNERGFVYDATYNINGSDDFLLFVKKPEQKFALGAILCICDFYGNFKLSARFENDIEITTVFASGITEETIFQERLKTFEKYYNLCGEAS